MSKDYNILIADNNTHIEEYKRFLAREGYKIFTAKNYSEAMDVLRKFNEHIPKEASLDKVLSLAIIQEDLDDLGMAQSLQVQYPDAKGLHLIQEVKSCFRPSRVCIVSDNSTFNKNGFHAGKLGADGYRLRDELQEERIKHFVRDNLQRFDARLNRYNKWALEG